MESTLYYELLTFDERTIKEIYQYALKFTDNSESAMLLTQRSLPKIVDYYTFPDSLLRVQLRQDAKKIVWMQYMYDNDIY
jgi:hypothetical protein